MLFPPEFAPVSDFKAGPGETAKIAIKVKASPDPDLEWFRLNADEKPEKIDKKDKKWERYATARGD